MKPRRKTSRPRSRHSPSEKEYELEVLEGLEEFALAEAKIVPDNSAASCRVTSPGRISLRTTRGPRSLRGLRTVVAVHLVERFQVVRPRALLGHQNMTRVLSAAKLVLAANRERPFESFRLSAAGKRLRSHDPNQGPDLQRGRLGEDGRSRGPSDNREEGPMTKSIRGACSSGPLPGPSPHETGGSATTRAR